MYSLHYLTYFLEDNLEEIEPGSKDWVMFLDLLKSERLYKERDLQFELIHARWVKNGELEAKFNAKKKEMESMVRSWVLSTLLWFAFEI